MADESYTFEELETQTEAAYRNGLIFGFGLRAEIENLRRSLESVLDGEPTPPGRIKGEMMKILGMMKSLPELFPNHITEYNETINYIPLELDRNTASKILHRLFYNGKGMISINPILQQEYNSEEDDLPF